MAEHRWEPPHQGQIKFNCDAAILPDNNRGKTTVIGRNHKGEVIQVMVARISCSSPAAAEALAIRDAVRYVVDQGLQDVVIKSDAKTVV